MLFEKERKSKMFCEWSGNTTKLYCDNRQLWRTFNMRKPVAYAHVSGEQNEAHVSITTEDGRTYLYMGTGQLIRG